MKSQNSFKDKDNGHLTHFGSRENNDSSSIGGLNGQDPAISEYGTNGKNNSIISVKDEMNPAKVDHISSTRDESRGRGVSSMSMNNTGIHIEVRQLIYNFFTPRELVVLASKLSSADR